MSVARRLAIGLAMLAQAVGPAVLRPAMAAEWSRFETILWHDHGPAALAGARALGVTAGLAFGVRDAMAPDLLAAGLQRRADRLRAAGLGVYVENIATDLYAAYHRWQPGHPVTWLFDQAQARHQADPADLHVFERAPGLSDPQALAGITARLTAHVAALGAAPLYYDLGDETGIADLTAAWDFDIAPTSLAGMRAWLRGEYGTLAALNAEWGSAFADWDAVQPDLTTAALARRDGNFAAWADFKAWMDTAFARALRAGTKAVHAADPAARAGIEGAQAPGWGGYDYTKLAGAVDVMEITDSDDSARAIAQAMNPALITLVTLSDDPAAAGRLWRAVLDGSRGAVLWDPDAQFARPDGAPGRFGRALQASLVALAGPLGPRLLTATPVRDPVGILYSPASFRIRWLLDRQRDAAAGQDWSRRRSETELEPNAWRQATRRAVAALAHLGVQPHWLAPAMLTDGTLARAGLRVLILPQALALSDAELAAIGRFAAAGGQVLADTAPGGYDAHGRRRASLPAPGGPAPAPAPALAIAPALARISAFDRADLAAALQAAGVTPLARLTRPDGSAADTATVRTLRQGDGYILAIQRDDNAVPADAAAPLRLVLARPLRLNDAGHPDGTAPVDRRMVTLSGEMPVLLDAHP